jgi:four helix bundle protein
MPFKFQNHVVYEQISIFAKDLFQFTGKLPEHESNGLIRQIRNLAINLLQDFTEGFVRTSKSESSEAIEKCIVSIAKVVSLIDLCQRLGYVDKKTNDRWTNICDELTKRLYETHKSLH